MNLFESAIFYLPKVLNTSRSCYEKEKRLFDLNLELKVSCRPYGRQSSAKLVIAFTNCPPNGIQLLKAL